MALSRAQLADPDCVVTDSDYEAIEFAIMETARGRWFLSEFARRNRNADTEMLLASIDSLKALIDEHTRAVGPYKVSTKFSSSFAGQNKTQPNQLRLVQLTPATNANTNAPSGANNGTGAQSSNALKQECHLDDTNDFKFSF